MGPAPGRDPRRSTEAVPDLLVHPTPARDDGTILAITPESVGCRYAGLEVLVLDPGASAERPTGGRELCIVLIAGGLEVCSAYGRWPIPGRSDPWAGPPQGAYLPPGTVVSLHAGDEGAEVALCSAPAPLGGGKARRLWSEPWEMRTPGYGAHEFLVRPLLWENIQAESLLVCEVLTASGHWSGYPPDKHDTDDLPAEAPLEEIDYHRVSPSRGFGIQRIYTADHSLDETVAFGDRDCVVVPRGFHPIAAPPGYDLYHLKVLAGPRRRIATTRDPDHAWTL